MLPLAMALSAPLWLLGVRWGMPDTVSPGKPCRCDFYTMAYRACLSEAQLLSNPYPPDSLPGGRVLHTPHAHIQVFERGPERGGKVLLIPGIATPVLSLSNMFDEFVARGYRVMAFGEWLLPEYSIDSFIVLVPSAISMSSRY